MIKITKTTVEPNLDIDHLAAKMIELALTAKFVLNPVLHLPDLSDWCHKWRSEIQGAYRYYLSGDCKYLVFVEYGLNNFDFWWVTEEEYNDPLHSCIGDKYRQLGVLHDEEAEDKHEETDEYV
jgi:hypothetical protein